MTKYANIIVDIAHEKLDKTFQYLIPENLQEDLCVGMQVMIPFGRRTIKGYVVELTEKAEYDPAKMKPILSIVPNSITVETQLISLAAWMRRNYGSTMNQALRTVLPVKQKKKAVEQRSICLLISRQQVMEKLALFEAKHYTAKARLLRELLIQNELDYALVTGKLHVTPAVIRGMAEQGILEVRTVAKYRNPVSVPLSPQPQITLNAGQQRVVDALVHAWKQGDMRPCLLKGVTGSGKTEVYMELIAHILAQGKQAIVLIPEIALTYQTVMRFCRRFGERVSIMNSRLSQGERYDQFLRAQNGDIDIIIGPRSALFIPFLRLGLIIIDEEHETSYKSETVPRYHAREVAIHLAGEHHAAVVLGSATPSVDSYYQAKEGNYQLLELTERVSGRPMPACDVVDLREELRKGNRSMFSIRLQELIEDRLKKRQQVMLFLNRRGLAGFVSCRSCGEAVRCPHCDVSLSQHNNGKLLCHYCGYEIPMPDVCPSCGSKYISGFSAGTQKIELMVQKRFPEARVLRMDFDTTRNKDSYEKILSSFANQEADILIGTQMIVKGHDFPNVTLVGVLAADLSLHVSDFHAAERTFALLTQAAGRAGRGKEPGQVIIQTYQPQHYAVLAAKEQDYEAFYAKEIEYRRMLFYPPVWTMLVIHASCVDEAAAAKLLKRFAAVLEEWELFKKAYEDRKLQLIGPSDAAIGKIKDIYRKVLYIKAESDRMLIAAKDFLEEKLKSELDAAEVNIQFDFRPVSGF